MAIIPGDTIQREWRALIYKAANANIEDDSVEAKSEDYAGTVRMFNIAEKHASPEHPAVLQERQFIPDDQQWGEWVTIMKSEGVPRD